MADGLLVETLVDNLVGLTLVEPLELVDVQVLEAAESIGLKSPTIRLGDVVPG